MTKKNFLVLGAFLGWFAVITQFILMINNRAASVPETIVRFFSFFTILTNLIVAVYYTIHWLQKPTSLLLRLQKTGILSAITLYIAVVGLVYQIVLRSIWSPVGIQKLVDELLHSIIPVFTLVYWFLYEKHNEASWKSIPSWLLYPLFYLAFILIRGSISNFYPYPFVNVTELGLQKVLINSSVLVFVFLSIAIGLVACSKLLTKKVPHI
jgi:hypothetical protein